MSSPTPSTATSSAEERRERLLALQESTTKTHLTRFIVPGMLRQLAAASFTPPVSRPERQAVAQLLWPEILRLAQCATQHAHADGRKIVKMHDVDYATNVLKHPVPLHDLTGGTQIWCETSPHRVKDAVEEEKKPSSSDEDEE